MLFSLTEPGPAPVVYIFLLCIKISLLSAVFFSFPPDGNSVPEPELEPEPIILAGAGADKKGTGSGRGLYLAYKNHIHPPPF